MSIIQKQILHKAIESPFFSKDVLTKAPLTIFEGNEIYKELSTIIKRYYQTKSQVLTEDALLTLTEDKLDRMRKSSEEQQEYFTAINSLYEIRDSNDNSIIDEKIESYIKKHMRVDLLRRSYDKLDNDVEMDKVEKEFREIMALDISGRHQEIINVIDDVEYKRRVLMTLHDNTIPTGISAIDEVNGGGLAKGEVGLVAALSGTGKTTVLTNIATSYTKRGYNVLFIALEELENRMILKLEQSMLRQNKAQIVTGAGLNEGHYSKMQEAYQRNRDKFGNLFFARYSPRTVTPAKIEQLISDVMIRRGVRIDVVVIDYPELLINPHATGNEADDGGKLFEEVRRIGQDFNVITWTASQMGRSARSALIRTGEHIEGAHRKINAVELVLAVNQLPEEYKAGFIRLYADKVRNPPDGEFNRMVGLKVIGSAMTIRDYANDAERGAHARVLQAADSALDDQMRWKREGKKSGDSSGQPAPDFASEINASIKQTQGGA